LPAPADEQAYAELLFDVARLMTERRLRQVQPVRGFRMALGASSADVLRLVMGNGARLVAIGLAVAWRRRWP
jgi:hypothetical protein